MKTADQNLQRTARRPAFIGYALALVSLLAVLLPEPVDAATRRITFRNRTGVNVDDLHIDIRNVGSLGPYTPFTQDRGRGPGGKFTLYGATIASPTGTATVTLTNQHSSLKIKSWYWTRGGNDLGDGRRVGPIMRDTGGSLLSFEGGRSVGDGNLRLTIDNQEFFFLVPPGLDGPQVADHFEQFAQQLLRPSDPILLPGEPDFALIHTGRLQPQVLEVAGNILGDPQLELQIEVLNPDSGLFISHIQDSEIDFMDSLIETVQPQLVPLVLGSLPDLHNQQLILTYQSEPGVAFSVEGSHDLQNYFELPDTQEGDGSEMQYIYHEEEPRGRLFLRMMRRKVVGAQSWTEDWDGDGKPDHHFHDTDGDGNPNHVFVDTDEDGNADEMWVDNDDDGDWDSKMENPDDDGDWDSGKVDTDGDGKFEHKWTDGNGDGKVQPGEVTPLPAPENTGGPRPRNGPGDQRQ